MLLQQIARPNVVMLILVHNQILIIITITITILVHIQILITMAIGVHWCLWWLRLIATQIALV
jgi:hypothetical protein